MNFFEVPDDHEMLKHLKPSSDLDLVDIEFYKITIDQNENQAVALFTSPDKIIGFDLNSVEGSMFTFVVSGCVDYTHVKTVYQLYLETMNMLKFQLEKVVIEARQGDMLYSRLHWLDHKNRKIFKYCSAGDGLVLGMLAKTKIKVIKKTLQELEDFTEYDLNLYDPEE
jgi:hypothetical protein